MKSILVASSGFVSCALLSLLMGCGGGNGTGIVANPLPAPGTVNDLRGGWLITGGLPTLGVVPGPIPTSLQMGMTLDVIGGQVSGTASLLVPCAPGPLFFGGVGGGAKVATTTVAADGTFTLQDVPLLPGAVSSHQFVIKGKLPSLAGGVWTGSYTAGASNALCNGVTPPTVTGTFTATRIQPLSGTFVGTGTLNASSTPMTLTASLAQGGPASLNVAGAEVTGVNAVEGSIQVQGSPCFTSGTIQNNQGAVLGTHVQLYFTMDDGSSLLVSGDIDNVDSTELGNGHVAILGGACDKEFGFSQAKFTKQ